MAGGEARKSDLGVRTASAVVMVAVAGTALWLGGWVWIAFVVAVALGVLWEWRNLSAAMTPSPMRRGLWNAAGIVYIGLGAFVLARLRLGYGGVMEVLPVIGAVMATDIGAYFTGRTLGGPKIAPRISPSKTWSGLIGGMAAAALVLYLSFRFLEAMPDSLARMALPLGAFLAVISQAGDFMESWMKRRAGVKDSGKLIPGHGGLFDRVDGLLAVLFALAVATIVMTGLALGANDFLIPGPA